MKLNEHQVQEALRGLEGWKIEEGRLEKTFSFKTYPDGVAFAVKVALAAEKADHHPDTLEIGWCKVKVAYTTHSAGGLTQLDFAQADTVDKTYQS